MVYWYSVSGRPMAYQYGRAMTNRNSSPPELPDDLVAVLASLRDGGAISKLLHDLLTFSEVEAVGERWNIVKLLAAGHSQRAVRNAVGVSVTTVSRGSKQLRYGFGGFDVAFAELAELGHPDPRDETEG